MASNPSEDDADGTADPSSSVSAARSPEPPASVAAAEPGKSPLETPNTPVEEESAALEDASQLMEIEVTGAGSGDGDLTADIVVDVEAATEVGAHDKLKEDEDGFNFTDVGEARVALEVKFEVIAEDAEIGLHDERMLDKNRIFAAELGAEANADAGGVGDHNVQLQEQGPPERRKRGRPRRSTAEDIQHARYFHPFQDEKKGAFAVSGLVWGKVRSHPWWPGQISDAADASDMALGTRKVGHFLVVYFGDQTFAWCDGPHLKPFQTHFAQLNKQSSADVFGTAVTAALGEVSRIVELGMACGCSGDEAYAILKDRKIENTGLREGTCSSAVDKLWIKNSFEPQKLIDYVRMLAFSPCSGADSLDLVIAKADLKAFRLSNGCPELPVFFLGQGLENDGESSPATVTNHGTNVVGMSTPVSSASSSQKEKLCGRSGTSMKKNHVLEDGRKKRSLSELMCEESFPPSTGVSDSWHSSGRRQKFSSSCPVPSRKGKIKKLDSLGDLTPESPNYSKPLNVHHYPNMQLRTSSIKGGASKNYSPYEMLSQLCLAARDPLKTCSSLDTTINFFTEFSSWVISDSEDKSMTEVVGGKRSRSKLSNFKLSSSDLASSDYIQDSYWSDIIVCSNFEEEIGSVGRKRNGESRAKRQKKKKRKKPKEQPEFFLPSGPMPAAKQYLQTGSASASIAHELPAEHPVDKIEENIYDCISITAHDHFPAVSSSFSISHQDFL